MKLYELMDTGISDQLKKTGKGIAGKTQSPPGLNPDGSPDPDAETGDDAPLPTGGQMGDASMDGAMGGDMGDPMGAGMQDGGMGGPPMGGDMGGPSNSPDPAMQEPADEDEVKLAKKKVDDGLLAQVKGLPFVTQYSHEKSKTGPYEILQMDNTDLSQTRTILKNKINQITMDDKYGAYDDPRVKYYQDMLSYVEHVITAKNELAKASRSGIEPKKIDGKD